jgi:hypothetical protein
VALAFPNTYWVGMSNLGFQTIYRLFNAEDDIVCERFFLPPKQELAELSRRTPLVTLESQTPVSDFDIVAFSVSFEWDYVNVLTLLRLAGIPAYATERSPRHPLIVVGGAVTFVNPEPLALFADVIAAGEGEVLDPACAAPSPRRPIATTCSTCSPPNAASTSVTLRTALCGRWDDRVYSVRAGVDAPIPVRKAALKVTDAVDPPATASSPRTPSSIPIPHRSRPRLRQPLPLLLGGLHYLPVRAFPADRILQLARTRTHSSRVGLVSIALCDHPEIERILANLLEMGYAISPASLRLDDLTQSIVQVLKASGERTIPSPRKPDPTGCAA